MKLHSVVLLFLLGISAMVSGMQPPLSNGYLPQCSGTAPNVIQQGILPMPAPGVLAVLGEGIDILGTLGLVFVSAVVGGGSVGWYIGYYCSCLIDGEPSGDIVVLALVGGAAGTMALAEFITMTTLVRRLWNRWR